jgi:hypothetical protein
MVLSAAVISFMPDKINLMKTRLLAVLLIAIILIESSCRSAMTPYQAANNPRGRKCRAIR